MSALRSLDGLRWALRSSDGNVIESSETSEIAAVRTTPPGA